MFGCQHVFGIFVVKTCDAKILLQESTKMPEGGRYIMAEPGDDVSKSIVMTQVSI